MVRTVAVPPGQIWTRVSYRDTFGMERGTKLIENWPDGKRIAVLLSFSTRGDIDAGRPNYSTAMTPQGTVNYVDMFERQYGIRCGLQRILSILAEYGVTATFPTCGATAEWYPDTVKKIVEGGHEIAAHSYWHEYLHTRSRPQLVEEIRNCTDVIEKVTGVKPRGWRSPFFDFTPALIDALIDCGYRWQSDMPNADLPFYLERPGGSLLQIPPGMDDWSRYIMLVEPRTYHMGGHMYGDPNKFLIAMRCEFDMLCREASKQPQIFRVCFQSEVTGFRFRAWPLIQIIRHCASFAGVWFATFGEIADLCEQ